MVSCCSGVVGVEHGHLCLQASSPHTKVTEMKWIRSRDFRADKAWGALDIANMNGVTTRLHWTDQAYKWHVNDGEEVFVVLTGRVVMQYRESGLEKSVRLDAGDIFFADKGCEHVAYPEGEARILVVELAGSI